MSDAPALLVIEGLGKLYAQRRGLIERYQDDVDRRVVRVLARGSDPESTLLAEVMTRDPDTIGPNDSVVHALSIMNERGFRHLPVVTDERIVGIVSIRDLYRSIKEQMDADLLMLAETLIQG